MNKHGLARFIRRWHARLGVTAALFFIVLIVTGMALNHTDRLGLAHTPIQSDTLARWYGLPPPQILAIYEADGEFIATPNVWLYRRQRLPEGGGAVSGVVHTPTILAVATAQSLSLFTPGGELIDTLRGTALPGVSISALGQHDDHLIVRTPQGDFASADGLGWQTTARNGIVWSHSLTPDSEAIARIRAQLAPALPLERIVLDLHSGRLLGHYGPLLMDAAALILLGLSASGVWIQWRSWRQKRRHPHLH